MTLFKKRNHQNTRKHNKYGAKRVFCVMDAVFDAGNPVFSSFSVL